MFEFKIEGLKELSDKCEKLSKNLNKDVIHPVLKEVLKDAKKKAKANVPVKTGELKKHIVTRINRTKNNVLSGVIFVKKFRSLTKRELKKANPLSLKYNKKGKAIKEVYYAHLVEYGTKYSKPKPFLRNSIDKEKTKTKLQKAINKELNNL
ncbi:HK97 gp10 family phage protein [Campylobacter ureolyticus]|uniref:HK97-gp10 family putative phage morphogenesis protein n=1 Tax=Campylobacter ureolyticus TaxID=827 RepID=UPI0022B5C01F|nr:HK97-gp10 family putative phage morphogenesis protein [Campylobacter ureolyticus]MCZ6105691.1 HK97 gp10 family phage protein [Campylobacter ureolyticus]